MQSVEGADHVGAFLREARENTGRTVADVAQTLRIRRVYLQAIEDGRFDELPGAAYAVGFVRSYATYLRLDVPQVVTRFKEEATGIEAPQELDFPTPVPEGRFPGGVIVTACIVIAAGGAGGWYWWQNQKNIDIARVPPPPASVSIASADTPSGTARASVSVVKPAPAPQETRLDDAASVSREETNPEASGQADTSQENLGPVEDMRVASVAVEPQVSAPRAPEPQTTEPDTSAPPTSESAPPESAMPEPDTAEAAPAREDSEAVEPEGVAAVPRAYLQPAIDPLASTAEPEPVMPAPAAAAEAETPPVPEPQTVTAPQPAQDPPAETETAPAEAQVASLPAIPEPAVATDADGRTYGLVNRNARIVLSARGENTWVQVMDSQENALLTQMLRPGDRYMVPDRPGLSLRTNNAGGLEISVDGSTVPSIGAEGDIRREVRLDPDMLKSGSAVIR